VLVVLGRGEESMIYSAWDDNALGGSSGLVRYGARLVWGLFGRVESMYLRNGSLTLLLKVIEENL
jgi:hypothetical protein